MNRVAGSIAFAFFSMLHPRMLWLMVWPMLIAIGIWGTVLLFTGAQLVAMLSSWMQQWIQSGTFLVRWDFSDAITIAAKILVFLAFIPLVYLTALLILSVFGMQAMVEHVAARRFAQLARRSGGSFAGSLLNSLVALAAYVPVVGLFAPVLVGLAFIHYLLGELQAFRQAPIEGEALRL